MATWDNLSSDQQAALTNHQVAVRDFAGQLARLINLASRITTSWLAVANAVNNGLDAGTEIPNDQTQVGGSTLTKEDLAALSNLAGLISDPAGAYNTPAIAAELLKAAGLYNTIQQGRN
jgi:hypothetical protein